MASNGERDEQGGDGEQRRSLVVDSLRLARSSYFFGVVTTFWCRYAFFDHRGSVATNNVET
jgi:hypothetical protein